MEDINSKSAESLELQEDKRFFKLLLSGMMGQVRVPRWRNEGDPPFVNSVELKNKKESVAEHSGSMHFIAGGIYEKARIEGDVIIENLDFFKISQKISHHDIEETLTSDLRAKTHEDRIRETKAGELIQKDLADVNIGEAVTKSMQEYARKETAEDRFVKAIDELQANMYMIGTRTIENSRTAPDKIMESEGYKYAQEFPTVARLLKFTIAAIKHPKLLSETAP